MRSVATIGTAAAVLVAAAESQAVTLLRANGDPAARMQRWAEGFTVPLVDETLTVTFHGCGGDPWGACTWDGGTIIQLSKRPNRYELSHELGHRFDYRLMEREARRAFKRLVRDFRPWRTSPNSPHEKFAEAYALCARDVRPRYGFMNGGYAYWVSARVHRRVCRLIRSRPAALPES